MLTNYTVTINFFKKPGILIFVFWVIFLSACNQNIFYENNKRIENRIWNMNDEVNFNVNITDTVALFNFYINIRNNHQYQYRNIYLFLKTVYPNGFLVQDTLNIMLADAEGNWLGSGMGDIKFNQVLVKKGIKFPLKGIYAFTLIQGMREAELQGITDIGIKIEKQ